MPALTSSLDEFYDLHHTENGIGTVHQSDYCTSPPIVRSAPASPPTQSHTRAIVYIPCSSNDCHGGGCKQPMVVDDDSGITWSI